MRTLRFLVIGFCFFSLVQIVEAKDLFNDIPISESNTNFSQIDWSKQEDLSQDIDVGDLNNITLEAKDYSYPKLSLLNSAQDSEEFQPYLENQNNYAVNLNGWSLVYYYQSEEAGQDFTENSLILPSESRILDSLDLAYQYGSINQVSMVKLLDPDGLMVASLTNPYYQEPSPQSLDKQSQDDSNLASKTKTSTSTSAKKSQTSTKASTKASTKKSPSKSTSTKSSTDKSSTAKNADSLKEDGLGTENLEQSKSKSPQTSTLIYLITGLIIIYCIYEYRMELASFWKPRSVKPVRPELSTSDSKVPQSGVANGVLGSGNTGVWQDLVFKSNNE